MGREGDTQGLWAGKSKRTLRQTLIVLRKPVILQNIYIIALNRLCSPRNSIRRKSNRFIDAQVGRAVGEMSSGLEVKKPDNARKQKIGTSGKGEREVCVGVLLRTTYASNS